MPGTGEERNRSILYWKLLEMSVSFDNRLMQSMDYNYQSVNQCIYYIGLMMLNSMVYNLQLMIVVLKYNYLLNMAFQLLK
jgi:hypothetical protein